MRSLLASQRCLGRNMISRYRRHASIALSGESGSTSSTVMVTSRCCSSSTPHHTFKPKPQGSDRPYDPYAKVEEKHPIIQLPARTLWCKQYPLDPALLAQGEFDEMIGRIHAARLYYQYPSMCAPQIGWNVRVFTLYDGSTYVNPVNLDAEEMEAAATRAGKSVVAYEEEEMARLREAGQTGFAWEPCASCCFFMHYVERPLTVRLQALNARGEPIEVTLDGMLARMALHEMDHMNGILFTRRVVDTNHVVPLDGFCSMSDWSDDYPSLEARSTFLYSIFTPPYTFKSFSVDDGNLLDRKYEEGVYPGCEHDRQQRIQSAAYDMAQKQRWSEGRGTGGGVKPAEALLPLPDEGDADASN